MKSTKSISLICGVLLLSACTDGIYEPPVQEEYTKNFVDQFGKIDPNQDWNMAEGKSVTVNTGSDSNVKIYAFNGGMYKLVGDYSHISGQQTLTFDAAKNNNDFMVVANGVGRKVSNGGTVDFTKSTRTYVSDKTGVFTKKTEYTAFTWDEVINYATRLPEGENNMDKGVTTNFKVIAEDTRKVTVYPVFWDADYNHTLGIFWKDANGKEQKQDIYSDKQGDDVQVYVNHSGWWETSGWESVNWSHFKTPDSGTIDTSKGIKSRGFTIDLPDGTEYGFYVKVYNGSSLHGTFYSDVTKNTDALAHSVFMRTKLESNGVYRTFLGFEDTRGGGDKDLNDFMLILDPAPLVIDEDVDDWIIACEDLGSTDDFDFNDVVFSVNHVAGQEKATVQLLAAGGTQETYILRDGVQIGQEVHAWLKDGHAVYSDGFAYPMINTLGAGKAGEAIEITVPKTFTIAILAGDSKNMGGFSIKVVDNKKATTTEVTAPGQGQAPQMICVPTGWKWPMERVNISEAYTEFGAWGANYVTSEWYKNPEADKVLTNK